MRRFLVLLCFLLVANGASAATVNLINWDIETNAAGDYAAIDDWGPNGSNAPHANHANPGYDSVLGDYFGYYSAGQLETVGQVTSEIIAANTTYDFWSWATGGGSDSGVILYQIGYADVTGDLSSFVLLAQNGVEVGDPWVETVGVSFDTGDIGAEIGKELIVRLGDGAPGESDIWFDNFQATTSQVPEPGTISFVVLGLLGLFRIHRKK